MNGSRSFSNARISGKALTVFFLLVIGVSAGVEAAYCMGGPEWLIFLLMWVPALSAFIAGAVSLSEGGGKPGLRDLLAMTGIRRCRMRFILLGMALPFAYLFIPYRIYWTMHPECYAYSGTPWLQVIARVGLYTLISVMVSLLSAAGEEIGWRGFMLPALMQRMNAAKAAAAVCLFWSLWHFPLLVWGGYMEGTPLLYRLGAFLLCIFPVGIMAAVVTVCSGSVWPAAFLHAAHNAYDQAVFGPITGGADRMFYVSETGILTILCAWLAAAVMCWLYRGQLSGRCR